MSEYRTCPVKQLHDVARGEYILLSVGYEPIEEGNNFPPYTRELTTVGDVTRGTWDSFRQSRKTLKHSLSHLRRSEIDHSR